MNDNTEKKHDGLPVAGYRPQSEDNVQLVNSIKMTEEHVLRILDKVGENPEFDKRWLAIARTNLEQGFMAANRAIFRPGRLSLPGDTPKPPVP